MVEQNVAARDLLENRPGVAGDQIAKPVVGDGSVRRVAQLLVTLDREAEKIGHRQRMVGDIDVRVGEFELPRQPLPHLLGRFLRHLETDLAGEFASLEVIGHLADDAARFHHAVWDRRRSSSCAFFAARRPGHPKDVGHDFGAGKQLIEVGGDHLFEGNETRTVAERHPPVAICRAP